MYPLVCLVSSLRLVPGMTPFFVRFGGTIFMVSLIEGWLKEEKSAMINLEPLDY